MLFWRMYLYSESYWCGNFKIHSRLPLNNCFSGSANPFIEKGKGLTHLKSEGNFLAPNGKNMFSEINNRIMYLLTQYFYLQTRF